MIESFNYVITFVLSCFLLAFSGKKLFEALAKIAKFLGWKEFVVAFFFVAFSVSIPNFFVGIISAAKNIPELSFGDVIGGNVVAMTFLVAIGALVSKGGLSAPSRTVQESALFTIFIAILPVLLGLDKKLSRIDGLILLTSFLFYILWLFVKKERFIKVYDGIVEPLTIKVFFKNFVIFLVSMATLLVSANLIVNSALFFAKHFSIPIILVGIFMLGLGNNLAELIFILQAATRAQDWIILGDLMGGVIITSTLVLGLVCLLSPFQITEIPSIILARIFLILASIFFFLTVRTDKKITRREAIFLLVFYLTFLTLEILIKQF
ncbi:sodium:calcium antiporter [Candidatus Parcubacteria bacterium]|nr:sodium:calcium antiporter [Candidatus Parcubacteria bacterium]